MKRFLFLVSFLILLLALNNPASALPFTGTPSPSLNPTFGTLVNFDDYGAGAVNASDYAHLGVASITETEGFTLEYYASAAQSAPFYLGTGVQDERGTDADLGWDGTIRFEFANLASMVGIGIANSRGGPEFISAYASDMSLIESYQVSSGINVYQGINTGTFNIKYLEITGDYFAVDDLQFDAAVPEPAAMLLLGTGLLGMAIVRRRVRK